jgi:Heme exporter protein D (CcmD)
MNHWPFILGAYAFALLGTFGVTFWSWREMRRAEADAEAVRRER